MTDLLPILAGSDPSDLGKDMPNNIDTLQDHDVLQDKHDDDDDNSNNGTGVHPGMHQCNYQSPR